MRPGLRFISIKGIYSGTSFLIMSPLSKLIREGTDELFCGQILQQYRGGKEGSQLFTWKIV